MRKSKTFRPDRIGSYFRMEWLLLALVTASGLIYNVGLLATPWFEGRGKTQRRWGGDLLLSKKGR